MEQHKLTGPIAPPDAVHGNGFWVRWHSENALYICWHGKVTGTIIDEARVILDECLERSQARIVYIETNHVTGLGRNIHPATGRFLQRLKRAQPSCLHVSVSNPVVRMIVATASLTNALPVRCYNSPDEAIAQGSYPLH